MKSARTYVLLAALLLSSCAPEPLSRKPLPPVSDNLLDRETIIRKEQTIRTVLEAAEKRNREIEKTPEWITFAYQGVGIMKLNDLAAAQYAAYRKYAENGTVYIFVHPSYYLFFHAKKPVITRNQDHPPGSIVDAFLAESYNDAVMRLEQQQQQNEKRFIEYLTTSERLVILVLPREYARSTNYAYGEGPDEYARYLNEIANGSPSILYIESETSSSGKLLSSDLIPLLSFLEAADAKSILIGGGYVGRCQKEFYHYITSFALSGTYAIVPEISTFSPEDVSEMMASRFLDDSANSLQLHADFVLQKTTGNVHVQHLPLYFRAAVLKLPDDMERADRTQQTPEGKDVPPSIAAPAQKSMVTAPEDMHSPEAGKQDYEK